MYTKTGGNVGYTTKIVISAQNPPSKHIKKQFDATNYF